MIKKLKPIFTLFAVAVFAMSFGFAFANHAFAISKDDKTKYEACFSAIKAANKKAKKKPSKNSQFKEGQTYSCPNDNGASIVFSNKGKKQQYVAASTSNNGPGSTPDTGSSSPTIDPKVNDHKKCGGGGFFSFPTWYEYLTCDGTEGVSQDQTGNVAVLIILAIIDILLTLAGFAAVLYAMYGGFKLITSQGQPDGITKGRTTILNAVVGLIIAILAGQIVGFIASKLS